MVVGERTVGEKMTRGKWQTSKNFQVLHKPFNSGDSCHNPWQVRFWSKAYYGQHKNEASIWSYSKTDICTKKMSETLTITCEVSKELSFMNSHQSSPVPSLSQEEVIINSSRTEITKNFNFFNCNVNIQWTWPFQRICKIFSLFSISFPQEHQEFTLNLRRYLLSMKVHLF